MAENVGDDFLGLQLQVDGIGYPDFRYSSPPRLTPSGAQKQAGSSFYSSCLMLHGA